MFLGRVTPVVRSFISIPAGIFEAPFRRYTILTLIGSAIWCFAFAGAGWAAGASWESFHHAFRFADIAVAVLLVAAAVARCATRAAPAPGSLSRVGRSGLFPAQRGRRPACPVHSDVVIPLVDVKAQYAPLIPELKERFAEVLESGRFIFGPEVEAFEQESAAYLDVPHAIGVANGTDALVLSLEAMGIGAGDEVICPPFTFYATSEAIARVGATPVFADIDPVTPQPRSGRRRRADHAEDEGDHARAPLRAPRQRSPSSRRSGLPLIEDAAQAFGATGVASTGVCSTFSFFPTKNLFALGDGGLVACRDDEVAERVRMLRFHGSLDKTDVRARRHQLAARRDSRRGAAGLPAPARRLERGAPRGGRPLRRARPRRGRGAPGRRAGPRVPHVRRADAPIAPGSRRR